MSDARDEMQAAHDAQLSDHSMLQAPAAMPRGEDVAQLIAHDGLSIIMSRAMAQTKARAILALFAPILAEKERLEEDKASLLKKRAEAVTSALAAEAALAAERERCALIAEKTGFRTISADIAAAIRAQGE